MVIGIGFIVKRINQYISMSPTVTINYIASGFDLFEEIRGGMMKITVNLALVCFLYILIMKYQCTSCNVKSNMIM